jgi:anaerobic selenocysteine-containing dehydrogenase
VRGAAETYGELPAACIAEEIDTPGDDRLRAFFTVAGNPVLSTPNGGRLEAALPKLDLMVSVDLYLNETSRFADVVLPVPTPMTRPQYDLAFGNLAIHDAAVWSPPLLPLEDGMVDEWQTLLRLAAIAMGMGAGADLDAADDLVARTIAEREATQVGSPWADTGADGLLERVAPRRGPERLVDLMLLIGPYGERGRDPWQGRGLRLRDLEEHPHGIDLGPLRPRIPEVLRTPSGRIEAAPQALLDDLRRLESALRDEADKLVLIGRRDLRTNNSWMHNVEVLARGERRCTLMVHPDDAAEHEVADGEEAVVRSRVGRVVVTVEVTDAVSKGVVSLPHGWGHGVEGARMRVAARHPGVNVNLLVDEDDIDPLSGTCVLNGVPVSLAPLTT